MSSCGLNVLAEVEQKDIDDVAVTEVEDEKEASSLEATVTATVAAGMDYSRVRVTGTYDGDGKAAGVDVGRKAIMLVVDASGSMSGSRMRAVRAAVEPFLRATLETPGTEVHVVKFTHRSEILGRATSQHEIRSIMRKLEPSGGTSFQEAARQMAVLGDQIIAQSPETQIAVLICSDGDVSKADAQNAHEIWKRFVRSYTSGGREVPYCDCIGVSRSHDADVLAGFIQGDENGNYTRAEGSVETKAAFERSMEALAGRRATRLPLALPFPVVAKHYGIEKGADGRLENPDSILVVNGEFAFDAWVPADKLQGEGMAVLVDNRPFPVDVRHQDYAGSMKTLLDYEEARVKDMLRALRETKEDKLLHPLAKKIDADAAAVQKIQLLSPEAIKIREKLATMMGELTPDERQERCALMTRLAGMKTNPSREMRKRRGALIQLCANVRQLCRDVIGGTKLLEIRQHILDLHFKAKHAKYAERLVLSDADLDRREARYQRIQKPDPAQLQDLSDDSSSGCFLSTLSLREIAADADSLWICGRVDREAGGGIALTRPECTEIAYISPFLVSGSYFQMALDVAPEGFVDGARELVNARLFPVYGNEVHFECTRPYLDEVLAHTASGRTDVRVPDKGLLFAVVGRLAQDATRSESAYHMLGLALGSLERLVDNDLTYPLDGVFQPDLAAQKIKLREFSKRRLERYLQDPAARRNALVGNTFILTADALLASRALSGNLDFWLGIALQQLRSAVAGCAENPGREIQGGRVLQCILRGAEDEDEQEADIYYGSAPFAGWSAARFEVPEGVDYVDPTDIGEGPGAENAFDAAACKHSMMTMCQQVLARLNWEPLIRMAYFFKAHDGLARGAEGDGSGAAGAAAFKCKPFENNFDAFVDAIGGEEAISGATVRALCGFAVEHYHKGQYKAHAAELEKLVEEPCDVLEKLHVQVMDRLRSEWQKRAIEMLRAGANKERFASVLQKIQQLYPDGGNLSQIFTAVKASCGVRSNVSSPEFLGIRWLKFLRKQGIVENAYMNDVGFKFS